MCRHLAYIGPPVALRDIVIDPPHSLYRQSWAPRRQKYGTVNADGFGLGWYAPDDPVPARYRRSGPIWDDPSFADVCRVTRSGALLGAVRDITEGSAADESAAAPYTAGPWLFSHNGALRGWPQSVAEAARSLPAEELLTLEARCDSALAWALTLHQLKAGAPPDEALAGTVGRLAALTPESRLNFLLSDGRSIAATAWGDTLWYLAEPGRSVVVASEPYDDSPRWTEVPDRHLLYGDPTEVLLIPLKEPHL